MLEGYRRLADQHREPVDRAKARGVRGLEQRGVERVGDDVVDHAVRRRMAEIEGECRLAYHAERAGVHDQVEAAFAVIEGKVGRIGEVGEIDRMMLASGVELVEQGPRKGLNGSRKPGTSVL